MKTNYIYGIKYEWSVHREPCLIFSKDSDWTENDLNGMEKKMLTSYPISKLLPLQLNEMDLQITLCYKLGNKKSLSHLYQHQNLSEMECYQLLFAIVSTLLNSKAHLLNEERYLLQESFIYIGSDHQDVNLIYLPIRDLADKPPLQQDLAKLANTLLNKYGKTSSPFKNNIIQQLSSSHFELLTLKELLLQAILELDIRPAEPIYQPEIAYEPWLPLTSKERLNKWRQSGAHNPVLLTGSLLIVMLIGALYLLFPSVGMLNLCLGLILLVFIISFGLNRSVAEMETGEISNERLYGRMLQDQAQISPDVDYYSQLADHTTLLAPVSKMVDATVLLSPPMQAFLELKQGEETELITITGDSFVIGRSSDAANFIVDWIGLSRTHFEINRLGSDYQVKDLGSKNGSFLNEEIMIPHQLYPLTEGDCIKVVEKQFIYKII